MRVIAKLACTFARSACRRGRDGRLGIETDLPLGVGKQLPALLGALGQSFHLRHEAAGFARGRVAWHLAHQAIMPP